MLQKLVIPSVFKVGLSPFKNVVFIYFNTFKNGEKCFLFCVKNPFRSWDIYIEKRLYRKTVWWESYNFKIYDVTDCTKNYFNTHIARYLKSKGNLIMNFDQLIEYNTKNIFLWKNHTQNVVEKQVPDSFIKNQNWGCLWINSLKCYKVYFCCMSKSRSTKIC